MMDKTYLTRDIFNMLFDFIAFFIYSFRGFDNFTAQQNGEYIMRSLHYAIFEAKPESQVEMASNLPSQSSFPISECEPFLLEKQKVPMPTITVTCWETLQVMHTHMVPKTDDDTYLCAQATKNASKRWIGIHTPPKQIYKIEFIRKSQSASFLSTGRNIHTVTVTRPVITHDHFVYNSWANVVLDLLVLYLTGL